MGGSADQDAARRSIEASVSGEMYDHVIHLEIVVDVDLARGAAVFLEEGGDVVEHGAALGLQSA